MKNKLRCKHLKKIFACCALVFLLFSISVPCFATGVYPTRNNLFAGVQTLTPLEGWSYDNCVAIADIVEKAYKLNYFSGGIPVAVVNMSGQIWVLVVPSVLVIGTETPLPGLDYQGSRPPDVGVLRSSVYCTLVQSEFYDGAVNIEVRNNYSDFPYMMSTYCLNTDNTFSFSACTPMMTQYNAQYPYQSDFTMGFGMVSSFFSLKADVLSIRFGDNDWRIPYADEYSDVDSAISVLDDWYNNQFSAIIVENNYEYELDIPSIITSIPNGAKQIINNVFGFEIFGINVAGFLSVLLIVAIVGFVVKWLMSR